jgi:hypothetical protein
MSTTLFVETFLRDLEVARKPLETKVKCRDPAVHARWIHPPADCCKMNVDAAVQSNKGVVRVVCRSEQGLSWERQPRFSMVLHLQYVWR